MFYSNYTHNIDPKGRIFIPARWRSELTDTVIITVDESGRSSGGFLQCMALKNWESYIDSFSGILRTEDKPMGLIRTMLADAFPCDVDKQGRILIPQHLREYAGLTGEALLTGMRDRIEIWEPNAWAEYKGNVSNTRSERIEALNDALKVKGA